MTKSNNGHNHPYATGWFFWGNPSNHFWETSFYTSKAKEYYRNWIAEMREKKSRYTSID